VAPGDHETAAAEAKPDDELAPTAEHGAEGVSPAAPAASSPAAADHGDAASSAASVHAAPDHGAPAHKTPAHTPNGAASAAASPTAPLVESGQIRRAIAIAQKRTDLNWSVFIGTLGPDPRAQAEARHAELGPVADKSALIAVDPAAHHLEIVTGAHARKHLDDRSCGLAAAAMTSSFAVRDLDGGIANGILALVEHVRSVR
jgi:hypothetical protein